MVVVLVEALHTVLAALAGVAADGVSEARAVAAVSAEVPGADRAASEMIALDSALAAWGAEPDAVPIVRQVVALAVAVVLGRMGQDAAMIASSRAQPVGALEASTPAVRVRKVQVPIDSPHRVVDSSTASWDYPPTRDCTSWARQEWARETSASVVTRASVVGERVSVRAELGDRPAV